MDLKVATSLAILTNQKASFAISSKSLSWPPYLLDWSCRFLSTIGGWLLRQFSFEDFKLVREDDLPVTSLLNRTKPHRAGPHRDAARCALDKILRSAV